jgi:guanosine-3',5'-bis(diphosphate) 3'-pyrophosphohydrolase
MVPIRQELHSGDQLEIITDKKVNPSPIWLRIVKTPSARQKLRQYFRKIQEESLGQDPSTISGPPLGNTPSNIISKINDSIPKKQISRKPTQEKKEVRVIVAGIKDTLVRIASCCHPLPGDEIIGFITKGRGVSVHKSNCETAQKLKDNMRIIPVHWDGLEEIIPVPIEVKARDVQGIYLKMVEVISNTQTNILEAGAISHPNGTLTAKFLLELTHLDQLEEILDNLRITNGIESAGRANRA